MRSASNSSRGNGRKGTSKKLSRVLWEEVEHQLERAHADLLVIFDCCHAGLLANDDPRGPPPTRIFEFLGATLHNKKALGPGESSFTSALVWALEQLVHEPDGFTTSQLRAKVRKAPNFERSRQEPVWSPRGRNPSLFRLKICPLDQYPVLNSSPLDHRLSDTVLVPEAPEENNQIYLQLQLTFDNKPSKQHISALAEGLKNIVKYQDVPLKQVRWKGLSTEDAKMDFRGAVLVKLHEVISHNRRHSSMSLSPTIERHELVVGKAFPQMPNTFLSQTTTTTEVDNPIHGEVGHSSSQAGHPITAKIEPIIMARALPIQLSGHWSYTLAFLGACAGVVCIHVARTRFAY